MEELMGNANIVLYLLARNKSIMWRENQLRQQGTKAVSQHFGQDFVRVVTEANGKKLGNRLQIRNFRNEYNMRGIDVVWKNRSLHKLLNEPIDFTHKIIPKKLVKNSLKSIKPGAFNLPIWKAASLISSIETDARREAFIKEETNFGERKGDENLSFNFYFGSTLHLH